MRTSDLRKSIRVRTANRLRSKSCAHPRPELLTDARKNPPAPAQTERARALEEQITHFSALLEMLASGNASAVR